MNLIKFLYDVLVWISTHYSDLPDSFKKSFPEGKIVSARLFVLELSQVDSELIEDFKDYE